MRKILLTVFLSFFTVSVFAVQPTNLAIDKAQIQHYVDSGQYYQDIKSVISKAKTYLAKQIAENNKLPHPKKLAIVLDIDETSLSNYPDMLKLNFGGTMNTINKFESEGHDPAIKPTLTLYNFAKKNNVAVFFITGRKENARAKTAKNLKHVGYKNWDGLYLKPLNYDHKSAILYKTEIRKKITNQGYNIVLNLGDQQSDLKGAFADKTFLLPNPFYIVP